ncbi:MAG: response regulator [Candidatus Omnitrophica bacterium]|nr:response regulator [Candidatus Omnitrophota bacterium]
MTKIFLVEDEKDTAVLVARFLERKGYEVDVAYSLGEAMEKFSSGHDIVLLDIMLGDEKCFPLLKKIKEAAPTTGVIMVSGYDDEENIQEAKKLGADGFVTKPFVSEHLEQVLLTKIHSLEKKIT